MKDLQVLEVMGQRVLTTQQIADCYGTTRKVVQNNFAYNRNRYVAGKHYIPLEKDDLIDFKALHEIQGNLKYAHILYLWTEKGALLHAKSLNTDKAWEVYDYLVDFYFRAKENQKLPKFSTAPMSYSEALRNVSTEEKPAKKGFDIAPLFRELLTVLPVEALDEMEKVFRGNTNKAVNMAEISILAEKMKRRMN